MIAGALAILGRAKTLTGRAEDGRITYSSRASYDLIPALDGLRAVSILMVVVSHAGFGSFVPGGFGVTIFFFVSGLLITRQLLVELASSDTVALGRFAMRRFLRLYPPMLAMLAIGTGVFLAAGGSILLGQLIAALLYFYNYGPLIFGWSTDPRYQHGPYDVLWSLAVEEHFYLLFPLLLLGLRRARARITLSLALLIGVITVWRCFLAQYCGDGTTGICVGGVPDRLSGLTDTRIDSILYGALLAAALNTTLAARILRVIRAPQAFWCGMLVLLASLGYRDPGFRETLRYTAQGLGLLLAVGGLLFSPPLSWARRLLSSPAARLVGRLSYSFYLWHWIVIVVALQLRFGEVSPYRLDQLGWLRLALGPCAVLSFGLACVSYYGLERPMLRLRRRFGSHSVADLMPAALAPVEPAT